MEVEVEVNFLWIVEIEVEVDFLWVVVVPKHRLIYDAVAVNLAQRL